MISPLANVTDCKPTMASYPLPGNHPVILNHEGQEIKEQPCEGILALKQPWPGMARTIWGDHNRYMETYFIPYPEYYFTGDGAKRDEDGRFRITGRVDDVINVSGHRIGTAEVEQAINEHPGIVESAVVGFPHPVKGQGIYAFVIPTQDLSQNIAQEVNSHISELIGPIAKADHILVVKGLPKTRSGKIMRRILRKIAAGEEKQLGDTSTLLNPEVVNDILAAL